MDVVGVPGVEAEAELLAAIVLFFERVGLGPKDVGIKVSSRKVLYCTCFDMCCRSVMYCTCTCTAAMYYTNPILL